MTEAMWIAILGSSSIPAALSGVAIALLNRQRKKLDRVDEQTSNTHDTNLRDDLDDVRDLAAQALRTVERVESAVAGVVADVKGVKRDVGRLDDRDVAHAAHHDRVTRKLDQVDDKLDAHISQAPEIMARITALERKERE